METISGNVSLSSDAGSLEDILASLQTPQCVYFPFRHHSPACSWHLQRLIEKLRPSVILIEGPSGFTSLIPQLLHAGTRPPVAIYTWFVDVERRISPPTDDSTPARYGAFYPLCEYSPELVALRAGRNCGARLRFIDLDYASRKLSEAKSANRTTGVHSEMLMREEHLERSAYLSALAQRNGCRDFGELWDHLFESRFSSLSTEVFMREVAAYCYFARQDWAIDAPDTIGFRVREAAMATAIADEIASRRENSGPVLVVTGGFHTVALPPQVRAAASTSSVSSPAVPFEVSQQALIRFSFPRMGELNRDFGGMTAFGYYNRLWKQFSREHSETDPTDSYSSVAADVLVEVGARTRSDEFSSGVSTADEIAALQHARLMAAVRGHAAPMREDLLDAIQSCFVKGAMDSEGTDLMKLAHMILTGNEIGDLKSPVSPPLVENFHAEASRMGLDSKNPSPRQAFLEIYRRQNDREASRFLHSLLFLGVPFAIMRGGPDFVAGKNLGRLNETWEYAWEPSTESSLVEASLYGATVEEATLNRLREAIAKLIHEAKGQSARAAVSMLVTAFRMGLHRYADRLYKLIEAKIAEEPSFVEAVASAGQLLLLWQSREPLEAHSLFEIPALLRACYLRACYLMPELERCAESTLPDVLLALSAMRELICAAGTALDEDIFWHATWDLLATSDAAFASSSAITGAAAGLLYSTGRIEQDAFDRLVAGHFGGAVTLDARIGFLLGLLRTCREVSWQSLSLMRSLNHVLVEWGEMDFVTALPGLRLAFADLTPRETDRVAMLAASMFSRNSLGAPLHAAVNGEEFAANLQITELVLHTLADDGLAHWANHGADHRMIVSEER